MQSIPRTVMSFDVASLTSWRFRESVQSSFFSASNSSLNKFASGAIEARPGGSVRSVNLFGLCGNEVGLEGYCGSIRNNSHIVDTL